VSSCATVAANAIFDASDARANRLAEERTAERYAVEPADQLVALPRFDRGAKPSSCSFA
jgi:hypothetical protein